MLADKILRRFYANFGFLPTPEQEEAMKACVAFLTDTTDRSAMILRGCAGSGKTVLASALVQTLTELHRAVVLLAPTGRAAKVFAQNSGHSAYTIHRHIYRQGKLTADMSGFQLGFNARKGCLFLVDEASMVSNSYVGDNFGSGQLLTDLVQFVYSGAGCRLMLIGDHAQLPPIGENESPALQADELEAYSLKVYEATMNSVMRQSQLSGILWNASRIRTTATGFGAASWPKVRFRGFADIHIVSGEDLNDMLSQSYRRVGTDETIVITRANYRANAINKGIRRMVFDREDELEGGDTVMIVRNNYYWLGDREVDKLTSKRVDKLSEVDELTSKRVDKLDGKDGECNNLSACQLVNSSTSDDQPDFIANGDRAIIRRLRHQRSLYGFRFADATMQLPDYDNRELTATILLDTLHSDTPALSTADNERLYQAIGDDWQHLNRTEQIKKIKEDPYYNALQVKYAYAVTCHKAQGGQWAHVYVDIANMLQGEWNDDNLHWLYTAFTRASEQLYLINWPKEMTEEDS